MRQGINLYLKCTWYTLNHVWHGGGVHVFVIVCVRCVGYIWMELFEEDVGACQLLGY